MFARDAPPAQELNREREQVAKMGGAASGSVARPCHLELQERSGAGDGADRSAGGEWKQTTLNVAVPELWVGHEFAGEQKIAEAAGPVRGGPVEAEAAMPGGDAAWAIRGQPLVERRRKRHGKQKLNEAENMRHGAAREC